ncbi:MAG TPA: M20/M25/M40 family metallo-hydrolase [Acetobacteraceae bacterium]|jgi:tripeptide aminopeptidase|nr:M20/M25/M40 family metallo-hydrolase [Acetobacteraceae bacterium]
MTQDVTAIMASPIYRDAVAVLDRDHDRIVDDIIRLTEISSPPFGEDARGDAYLELLRACGLTDVEKDAVGNVMGLRRGIGNGPLIVVAAHLDTVFPAGTNVTVRREGTKLFAPGIGDDTRSLAVLLGFIRAMDEAGIRTTSDILFVGDVGEEGLGDLRGVRHLFHEGQYKDRIKAFFTVDSPEMTNIATGGIGSRRWRVAFRGPGGHSYGAFGLVSPMNAMAHAVCELARVQVPGKPKTTYSVSVVGGGTSINAIPNEVWIEVDLRSAAPEELARLEARFLAIIEQAAEGENHARSITEGRITVESTLVGDRPAGSTSLDSAIVRHATAAIEAHGFTTSHVASSTDANIPMALGIPAIKIGSGGSGGRAHSLREWIDVDKDPSLRGMSATLTAILAVAGVAL